MFQQFRPACEKGARSRYGKRSFFARTKKGEEKPRYFFQADGGPEVLLLDSAKMNGSISVVAPSWDGLKVPGGPFCL